MACTTCEDRRWVLDGNGEIRSCPECKTDGVAEEIRLHPHLGVVIIEPGEPFNVFEELGSDRANDVTIRVRRPTDPPVSPDPLSRRLLLGGLLNNE